MTHVVFVWWYTKIGTAWFPFGAHMGAVPLGGVIAPLAYTTLQDGLVMVVPLMFGCDVG